MAFKPSSKRDNQMGREALEGLHVSPKPAASSQQENQQTYHFPSRYTLFDLQPLTLCINPSVVPSSTVPRPDELSHSDTKTQTARKHGASENISELDRQMS